MPDWDKLVENLEGRGYAVSRFAAKEDAADYLAGKIQGRTVGIGGSVTIRELGLYERLGQNNQVIWHWVEKGKATLDAAARTQVYLSSVNGLAETGEIVNIDGRCNRVASILYGHEEVYLVVGANKVVPDAEAALWRARNVAAPKNAQRLGRKTPCAVKGDRCYDCASPQRLCSAAVTLWRASSGVGRTEVVLVEEDLGY